MTKIKIVSLILLYLFSLGCAGQMQLKQTVPEINETRSSIKLEELRNLPKPDRKVVVTVYRFQDKTGQFHDSDKLRYSTAVTQGATSQLITALMRARYFTVVERAHLDDIITEQRLKTEKRVLPNTGPQIGKMYGAEYIITGDITEYNVDVVTGGLGVRVSGAGGSAQYAVATAAIDLRIVESTTGKIVFNKSLKKRIVGKQVGVNIFRFWDNRLYEINGGLANQDPVQLAIRELLEEGVFQICNTYAKAYQQKKVAMQKSSRKNRTVARNSGQTGRSVSKATAQNRQNNSRKATAKVPTAKKAKVVKKQNPAPRKSPSAQATIAAVKKPAPAQSIRKASVKQATKKKVTKVRAKLKAPSWAKNLSRATVKGDVVNVRMGPGLQYGEIFKVQRGQVLYVVESNLVWNLIKTNNGDQGWIRTDKILVNESKPFVSISEKSKIREISKPDRGDMIEKAVKSKNRI